MRIGRIRAREDFGPGTFPKAQPVRLMRSDGPWKWPLCTVTALSRAEAYGDIMSRATGMFGDFLQHDISVTPRAGPGDDSP